MNRKSSLLLELLKSIVGECVMKSRGRDPLGKKASGVEARRPTRNIVVPLPHSARGRGRNKDR